MRKRILLISGNYYPEPTGIGKYSGEMIDWLSENGFDCTVITTFPYYPDWKVQKKYSKSRFWYKKETRLRHKPGSKSITIIRCPHYIPTSPTGFKRLLSEFTILFFSYLALITLLFARKFNFVLTIAPPFELGLLGVLYKKIRGTIFLYHIQDLQIDAARELGMIKSNSALRILTSLEKYIINHADYLSTISQGMIKKIKLKCDREVIYFPNWVDTDMFHPLSNKAELKREYGFKPSDKVILYSGAIGEKQGLKSILYLAKFFSELDQVKFVICGSGPYKEQLVHLKNELGINNLTFLPLQPPSKFNTFLNIADIHLVLQKSNAGDLVMPSKLSTILAVGGVAIVTASRGTGLFDVMNSSDMGILIEPEDPEALKEAILSALSIDTSMKKFNARAYAVNYFSIHEVLSRFFETTVLSKNIMKGREEIKNEKVVLSGQS